MSSRFVLINFFLLLFCVKNTIAQSTGNEKAFYLNGAAGVSMPDLSNFNSILKSSGLLPFSSVYFSRGGGFFTTFPKARLASIFNFATYSGSKTEGTNHNWVRSTQIGTSLGLIIKNSNGLQLIPYGGLAYSFFGATVSGNAASGGSFSGYFQRPANQHHVTNNGFMVNMGLHIAKTNLGKSKPGEKLLLGGRFGYNLPLGKGSWKADDVKLDDGPQINAGGFYATFIFGIKQ